MTAVDHQQIDARLLRLVAAVFRRIERDATLRVRLAENLARWPDERARARWAALLRLPWPEFRARLLADTPEGAALRQEAPLGGLLPAEERTRLMREFAHDPRAA
jgi:hypothetical protein